MAVRVLRAVMPLTFDLRQTFALQKCGAGDPTAALVDGQLIRRGGFPAHPSGVRLGDKPQSRFLFGAQFEKVHLGLRGHVVHHQLAVVAGQLHHTTTVIDDDVDDDTGNDDEDVTGMQIGLDTDRGVDAFGAIARKHPQVERLRRQHHGLRLVPVPWLFDVAASVVLQQRVRFVDAARSFAGIARRFGPMTPLGRCFPHPRVIAGLAADELMPLGVDGQRARALQAVAREALHTDLLAPLGHVDTDLDAVRQRRRARLQRLPGIGPWTTNMIMGFGFGDPDAVVTGDLHLPHLVTSVLGEAGDVASDERLEALLSPFAAHRFRVVRLLWAGRFGKRPPSPARAS